MLVVDRIEGNFAIVEIGDEFVNIPLSEIGETVSEGDVLRLQVDKKETESLKNRTKSKLEGLFNRKN